MRVAVVQPALPHYRVPFFDAVGAEPDLELTVYCGRNLGDYQEAIPNTFELREAPQHEQRTPLGSLIIQPRIRSVIEEDPDVIVLSWNTRNRSVWEGIRLARKRKIPVLLWGHGYSKRPSRIRDWLRNRLGRSADGVILYSRTIGDRLARDYGYLQDRVFVAQNAIDQGPIRAARKAWEQPDGSLKAFQLHQGLDPDRTIIFVSRLYRENGLDILLKALVRMAKDDSRVRAVVVGDGPGRALFQEMAQELDVDDRVVWTGAIYDEHELASWMLSSTLFCYPRNIGLSILHAFGYSLPVVTGDNIASHNPEIEALEPGGNGLLVRDRDPIAFAEICLQVMSDKTLREKMGYKAMETVSENYTLENMVAGFKQAILAVDASARISS